jgi:hypothetical protein
MRRVVGRYVIPSFKISKVNYEIKNINIYSVTLFLSTVFCEKIVPLKKKIAAEPDLNLGL